MRFGIMYDFRNPQRWYIEPPVFYRAMLDQMVVAENIGFDHIWLTEHHFTEDAYNPSPLSMAAAIAAVTQRIRIGTFVMLMPFIHPVRAAEDITLADILSNGRFDIGVGQGYTHEEFDAFVIDVLVFKNSNKFGKLLGSQYQSPPPPYCTLAILNS